MVAENIWEAARDFRNSLAIIRAAAAEMQYYYSIGEGRWGAGSVGWGWYYIREGLLILKGIYDQNLIDEALFNNWFGELIKRW